MFSIFLSLFEQLLIIMSVLTIENAFFKRKIEIPKLQAETGNKMKKF